MICGKAFIDQKFQVKKQERDFIWEIDLICLSFRTISLENVILPVNALWIWCSHTTTDHHLHLSSLQSSRRIKTLHICVLKLKHYIIFVYDKDLNVFIVWRGGGGQSDEFMFNINWEVSRPRCPQCPRHRCCVRPPTLCQTGRNRAPPALPAVLDFLRQWKIISARRQKTDRNSPISQVRRGK